VFLWDAVAMSSLPFRHGEPAPYWSQPTPTIHIFDVDLETRGFVSGVFLCLFVVDRVPIIIIMMIIIIIINHTYKAPLVCSVCLIYVC